MKIIVTIIFAAALSICVAQDVQESVFTPALNETKAAPEQVSNHSKSPNRVAIINDGYEALLLRIHLIRQAKRMIEIQTFIWSNDECGRLMMYELIEAARRGVKVRIIADPFVSEKDPATIAFLATAHPNLEMRHYSPAASRINPSFMHTIASSMLSLKSVNQRMHNKTVIVDGIALITGGRNIENTYFNHSSEMNFKDRDALVVGPIVSEAVASFDEYWNFKKTVASTELVDVQEVLMTGKFRRYDRREDYQFGTFFKKLDEEVGSIESRFGSRLRTVKRMRFIVDHPGKNRSIFLSGQGASTRALSDTIADARSSLIIQTPYLVLSDKASGLFKKMRERRPNLRIAVSTNSFGSTDNILAYSANYRMRAKYMEELGMQIYEYMPHPSDFASVLPQHKELEKLARVRIANGRQERMPFLCIHAKSFVVDDRIAFIGSFNLDPRSENLNTEVGLLIDDPVIAAQLKADILNDMKGENSWVIGPRKIPLQLDKANSLLDKILGRAPVDLWPLQNTTSFQLIPGKQEVHTGHPAFHQNYREAGDFPGADGLLSNKEIVTRLYKAFGPTLTPLL